MIWTEISYYYSYINIFLFKSTIEPVDIFYNQPFLGEGFTLFVHFKTNIYDFSWFSKSLTITKIYIYFVQVEKSHVK